MCSMSWVVANKPSSSKKEKQKWEDCFQKEKNWVDKNAEVFLNLELSENLDQEVLSCEIKKLRKKNIMLRMKWILIDDIHGYYPQI